MTTEDLEKRQRLFDSIKDVKDEYTKKVLYSQFIDMYYTSAFDAVVDLFMKGQIHRCKPEVKNESN